MLLRTNRYKIALYVILAVLVLVGIFGWWRDTLTRNAIQQRVSQGIDVGFQEIYDLAPRVKTNAESLNTGKTSTYYVPDMQNLPPNMPTLYEETLQYVNEDMNTPICKISNVVVSGYGDMHVFATVKFRGFLGIIQTIDILKAVNSPHFKNSTGPEHY